MGLKANKPQLPSVNERISAINNFLAPPLPNHYSSAPTSLLQLQQKRGQMLGNLGLSMQPMLPNTGNHLLNPLNHAAHINFVKNLLKANSRNNQEMFLQR